MSLQPRPWLAGLLPVALLAAASLWWKQTEIEQDLARRAGRAVAQAGATVDGKPWPKVAVVGRDAVIQGTAPSVEAQQGATRTTGEIFGVRHAAVAGDLLPLADPFGWSARREAASLTLTGQVAADGSRERLVLAARNAVPGAEIHDQMVTARGVPAVAAGAAAVGIAQLGHMATGAATLVGSTFSLSGIAADEAARTAVEAGLSGLPNGVTRGPLRVEVLQPVVAPEPVSPPPPPEPPAPPPPPPAPPPLAAWSAIKTATGITLSGTVASETAG
jgi:OmpA-OmpF porin, OOP family